MNTQTLFALMAVSLHCMFKIIRDECDKWETSVLSDIEWLDKFKKRKSPINLWHFMDGLIYAMWINFALLPSGYEWKLHISAWLISQFLIIYPMFNFVHHFIMRIPGSRDWFQRMAHWDILKFTLAICIILLSKILG